MLLLTLDFRFQGRSVPSDLEGNTPTPDRWMDPLVTFSGPCQIDNAIKNQKLVRMRDRPFRAEVLRLLTEYPERSLASHSVAIGPVACGLETRRVRHLRRPVWISFNTIPVPSNRCSGKLAPYECLKTMAAISCPTRLLRTHPQPILRA